MAVEVQKVAVIGSGAAGLCCARHFTSDPDRFEVQVYEKGDVVGGTWVYSKECGAHAVHSSMYKNLRTNLPKEIMKFPDFPFPSHLPSFPGHQDVLLYLQSYAKRFDVIQYVQFNTAVEEVQPIPVEQNKSKNLSEDDLSNVSGNGESVFKDTVKWRVRVRDLESGELTSNEFDRVLVCNGHYFEPYIPDIPGFSSFSGHIIHSHRYREPADFADQHVLVVGTGPSGIDIILDLSPFCKHVYISNRGAPLITSLPRNVTEVPGILKALEGGRVEFVNGNLVKVNSVIFATGYSYRYPFLTKESGIVVEDSSRVKPLYKHTFNSFHPSIAFVSVHLGLNPFPMFDYQIRWIKSVWCNKTTLPSEEDMIRDEEAIYQNKVHQGLSLRKTGHYLGTTQWELLARYAELGGCEPLAPVYQMIYEAVSKERKQRLMWYKETKYRILGKDRCEIVSNGH